MSDLVACDVFVSRGPSLMARGIQWATRERGESPTHASHAGVIVSSGPWRDVYSIEALERVVFHRWGDKYARGHWVEVYRPRNLTDDQRATILHYLHGRVGDRYGYAKIGLHLLRKLTGWEWPLRHPVDRWPICSYLVARAFREAGLDFGVHEGMATPDDIHDFCARRADLYERVYAAPPSTEQEGKMP